MYGIENKMEDNWIRHKKEELIHPQYPNLNQNYTVQKQSEINYHTQQKPTTMDLE